ncbi:MAG: hypothetical protein ACLRW4_08710 [Ruminococcus sp.]
MDDSNSLAAVKAAMARPAEFSPKCVDSTSPSLYIETTGIEVDGQILANTSDYTSTDTHSFDAGISYTDVDGIVTFRGNNFRDTAAYGNTQIKNGKIQDLWTAKTGSITYGDATWSGSGWTGQPLMEKWSQRSKEVHEYVRLGKGKRRSCGSDLCLHGRLCIFPGSGNRRGYQRSPLPWFHLQRGRCT